MPTPRYSTIFLSDHGHRPTQQTNSLPQIYGKKTDTVFGADGYSGSSVFIPTKFTTIASKAFESSKIIELSIPSSIKEIKLNAFKEATIERLMIQDLESWLTIKFGNQSDCGAEVERVFIGCEEITSIDIPTTVEQLNPFVFNGWRSLQYINLPNTINTIGKRAFAFCKSLKMVIIPESVKEIQKETFQSCLDRG
jgi:hypothetical protein